MINKQINKQINNSTGRNGGKRYISRITSSDPARPIHTDTRGA